MAAHKQRKFSGRGRSAPESSQTDSAPIRACPTPTVSSLLMSISRMNRGGDRRRNQSHEKEGRPLRRPQILLAVIAVIAMMVRMMMVAVMVMIVAMMITVPRCGWDGAAGRDCANHT